MSKRHRRAIRLLNKTRQCQRLVDLIYRIPPSPRYMAWDQWTAGTKWRINLEHVQRGREQRGLPPIMISR